MYSKQIQHTERGLMKRLDARKGSERLLSVEVMEYFFNLSSLELDRVQFGDGKFDREIALPIIDTDVCIQCEACLCEAPDLIRVNDDGNYEVTKQETRDIEDLGFIWSAVCVCPVEAIVIRK